MKRAKSGLFVLLTMLLILGSFIISVAIARDQGFITPYDQHVTTVSITDIVNGNTQTIDKLKAGGVTPDLIEQIKHQFSSGEVYVPSSVAPLSLITSSVPTNCSPGATAIFTHGAGFGSSYWKLSNGRTSSGIPFSCSDAVLGCASIHTVDALRGILIVSHEVSNSNWISFHNAWCS